MGSYIPAGLVLLIGAPASGKSTLAQSWVGKQYISPAGVISTDAIRAEICGDATDQTQNDRVFSLRDSRVMGRLRAGMTTIIDSTNLDRSRRTAINAARRFGLPVTAVRFDTPLAVCQQRNAARDRMVPPHIIEAHFGRQEKLSDEQLLAEGVDQVVRASDDLVLLPDGPNAPHLCGPFDIVGDVHGQLDTLERLMTELGYDPDGTHPDGRLLVLVGDVVDKGPESIATLRRVMDLHRQGRILMVRGNHEAKLAKVISRARQASGGSTGRMVQSLAKEAKDAKFGLSQTLQQLRVAEDFEQLCDEIVRFVGRLPLHLVLDNGDLVVTHAAIRADQIGRTPATCSTKEVRDLERWCLYGPTSGRKNADGLPERIDWTADHTADAFVVRGHVTVSEPTIQNRVVSVDIGAGDGARLCAFRWPEKEFHTAECDMRVALSV